MKIIVKSLTAILIGVFFFTLTGCEKQHIDYLTTSDVNIVDYLRRYPDKYSELVKVLDRTNISPYLNAYGTYTCFAPTNDAFKTYLSQIGKTSTDDIDTVTLKNILRLHLINDTIRSTAFTDGKLYSPTMLGQYLTTGVNSSGNTVINRQAIATQLNIQVSNGIIHEIDHVLQPVTQTIAVMIAANSKYSIITQALKETGWYDTLNTINTIDTTRRWATFFAESDSVLKVAGYSTYAAFKAKFCNTGNPKNPADSLNLYMAYHTLFGIKYLADIVSFTSHSTYVPQQVVTQTLSGQAIYLNQATFNGVFEQGVLVDRTTNSDNSCTNGVWHNLLGQMLLKIRNPYRVDFDLAAQPEIIKLTSVYRRAGKSQVFAAGTLSEVTWQNTTTYGGPQYYCEAATTSNYYWFNDHFDWNMRYGNPAANNWIEFKTPLIVKGKYKVWVNLRKSSIGQYIQLSVDGVALPKIVDFTQYLNTALSGAALEATGYKRYAYDAAASINTIYGVYAGVVDITTTDRHQLRFTCVKDQGSGAKNDCTVDFVQFIPYDQDQERPLYAKDGTIYP